MRNPGHSRLTRRSAIAAAAAIAAVVAGGGYALASTGGNTPARGSGPSIQYITGPSVTVSPHSTGQNAAQCPPDMYPVGGGMNSFRGVWETQWSYADSSNRRARHPDEWTVGLLNDGNSRADFRVFVVCTTADSGNGNP